MTPEISIIIPVFNSEKYLRRCLLSVISQTMREIEIICINDGSSDRSLEILEEFARQDDRIVLINQSNEGCANARNRGLDAARARYIGFVDSDDFIAPDMYEKMYIAMTENKVDFVECGAELFFTYTPPEGKEALRNLYGAKDKQGIQNERDSFWFSCAVIWTVLFRKDLLQKYGIIFKSGFNSCEDTLFLVEYKSISAGGYYIKENLYMYFFYQDSIMGRTYSKRQGNRISEVLDTIELYYDFLVEHCIFEELKYIFWSFYMDRILFFFNWADTSVIQPAGIKQIKDFLKGKDISYLKDEKYSIIHKIAKMKDKQLLDISCFGSNKRKIIRMLKCILPYGLVRLIQRRYLS